MVADLPGADDVDAFGRAHQRHDIAFFLVHQNVRPRPNSADDLAGGDLEFPPVDRVKGEHPGGLAVFLKEGFDLNVIGHVRAARLRA